MSDEDEGWSNPTRWMDGWMDAHEHEGGQEIVRVGESEAEIYVYANENGNENEHRRRPRQRRAVSEQSTRWRDDSTRRPETRKHNTKRQQSYTERKT